MALWKQWEELEVGHTAYLSNQNDYIIFSYHDKRIRFKGPYSLLRFDRVTCWDNGYIVVDALYEHSETPVEDYIDLTPILQDLYIDPQSFLKDIDSVEVQYA